MICIIKVETYFVKEKKSLKNKNLFNLENISIGYNSIIQIFKVCISYVVHVLVDILLFYYFRQFIYTLNKILSNRIRILVLSYFYLILFNLKNNFKINIV
jgi:hypothetical protein